MFRLSKFSEVVSAWARLFFQMFFSSFEYFSSFPQTLRPYFSSFGSLVLIHRMILLRKELRKSFPSSRWALNLRPCRHQSNSLITELLRTLVLSSSFVGWHSDHIFQSHMSLWLTRISIRFKKLPTYSFPKPTFCPNWKVSFNIGLGEGRSAVLQNLGISVRF